MLKEGNDHTTIMVVFYSALIDVTSSRLSFFQP